MSGLAAAGPSSNDCLSVQLLLDRWREIDKDKRSERGGELQEKGKVAGRKKESLLNGAFNIANIYISIQALHISLFIEARLLLF